MKFEQETLFCRSVYIVCSRAAAIFRFLFSTCKWVESFQSYVNYDNSAQECQKSWKLHGLTSLQNVTPLDQSLKKGEKMFVQKLSLGSFGLLRFFFEVEFMGQLNFFLAPIVFFLCCSTCFPCFAIFSIVCKKPNFCSKKYLEKSKLIFRPKIQG